ncbi:MAG: hypothetical protein C0478_14095 [Planctomyces sp.]|nr:hypothetical protein [Planctomyces sp.]
MHIDGGGLVGIVKGFFSGSTSCGDGGRVAVHSTFENHWLNSSDGQSLCALINGDLGWLMYLRYEGDSGFSSRNPDYDGPPDAEIEYVLDNGQHDFYPASWAIPVTVVRQGLEHFRQKNEKPPFVVWNED